MRCSRLRLNIAQSWNEKSNIHNDQRTWGYTDEQMEFLKENYKEKIMGKSKWDFKDCFWPKNGLYATVEGDVKVCCLNTGAKSFGNIYQSNI